MEIDRNPGFKDQLRRWNLFNQLHNHGMVRIIGGNLLETLERLELIESIKVEDITGHCIIGWRYEL